jgi:DNA-binding IclR family transcriptional regulator
MNKKYHSSTIQRAIDILNLFIEHDKLSFTEMKEILGYNKSTLYRVLSMLDENNYLNKDTNNRYQLGINIFILGNKFSKENQIKHIAEPFMEEISKKTGLTTELGIIEGRDVVILCKVDPPESLMKFISLAGVVIPAHCTGIGKSLLAFSKEEQVNDIIDYHGLKKYNSNTITSRDELMQEIKEIRERGYSINNGEQEEYIKNISLPILNKKGYAEAAIGVTGFTLKFDEKNAMENYYSLLKDTANKIEKKLQNLLI